jgi:hypothetical protein
MVGGLSRIFAKTRQAPGQLPPRTTSHLLFGASGYSTGISGTCFDTRECSDRHPASLGSGLQSASAVHLSAAGSFPPTKDPTDTIRHIVEVMLREVATLPEPIPWAALLLNTS